MTTTGDFAIISSGLVNDTLCLRLVALEQQNFNGLLEFLIFGGVDKRVGEHVRCRKTYERSSRIEEWKRR